MDKNCSIELANEVGLLRKRVDEQEQTIEALRASNHRFRLSYERSPDGIVLTTTDGAVLFANPRASDMLGMTEDELRAAGTETIIAEDLEPLKDNRDRTDNDAFRGEATLRRKDGQLVPVEMSVTFFKDADGTFKAARLFRDITERKLVEATVAEHLKGLQFLSSSATRLLDPMPYPELFAYIGDQLRAVGGRAIGIITEYRARDNQAVVQTVVGPDDRMETLRNLLGRNPEQLTFSVPDDIREHLTAGSLVRVEGGIYELAFRQLPLPLCRHLEQRLDIGDIYVMPFVLGKDFLGTVAIGTDRAEGLRNRAIIESLVNQTALALKRKRMEEEVQQSRDELEQKVKERTGELEASNRKYRDLSELLPEMVFEADLTGRFTYANRQALSTFGYTREDFRRGIRNVDVVAPKERERLLENGARILRGERRTGAEYVGRRKDGTEFPIVIRAVAIEIQGTVVGFRGVVLDLTESRKAEEEHRRLLEQLHQATKMEAIGTLAGGIAHDFNNMLAVIIGNAELALDDMEDGEGPKRNVEQIIKASKRARDLVKEILTFSRKAEHRRKPLKLGPLVEETFKLLRGSLPSTIHMKLRVQAASDTVIGDPSQIQQVLMNLATNAAHAIGDKRGTLSIGLDEVTFRDRDQTPEDLEPGTYLKLSVKDNGTGMTKEIQQRIFEPFFTTKEHAGTGMGLAVVYGIVKNHNGTITVESSPGSGSAFHVFLPHKNVKAGEEPQESGRVQGGRERIIVVDDEPAVVEMVSMILERLGYTVMTAESGIKAWDIFKKSRDEIDLVITDQTMPDITGIELAKKIMETRRDIPIILVTGYSKMVSSETARDAGIREFLMKPIEKKALAKAVRRVLENKTDVLSSGALDPDIEKPRSDML